MACSMSPAASISAARQSEKPAPVLSRSSFTSCADGPPFPGSGAVAMDMLNSFSFEFDRSGWAGPGECTAARKLFRGRLFVARHGRRGVLGGNRFAFDEVAFLLLVLFVRAGVHVFGPVLAAYALGRLLVGDLRLLKRLPPRHNRIGNLGSEQANVAKSVVVAGNDPVNQVRVAIGVHNRHHRNPHPARFTHCDHFGVRVDHEHGIGKRRHVFDTGEVLQQVLQLAIQARTFLLRKLRHAPVFGHCLQQLESLDRLLQGGPVGERAAEPAVVHVEHPAALGFFRDRFLSLAFRSQEQDALALSRLFGYVACSLTEQLEGLLQVNNVDSVALSENVFLHLRIPASSLVAKMNAGLQKLLHRNFDSQNTSSLKGCFRSRPPGTASFSAGSLPAANSDQSMGPNRWCYDYRLLNWKRRRAPFCPYFLRSFMRESRVRKPFLRNAGRSSGLILESARESPMRTAPDCPPTPPPFTMHFTSSWSSICVNLSGSTAAVCHAMLRKYSSTGRPFTVKRAGPILMYTRAIDSRRRPVP